MSAIRRTTPKAIWIALAIAAGLAGCNDQSALPPARPAQARPTQSVIAPIDVSRIELGSQARPDGTISHPTTSFKPTETVFAAVTTERPGHDIQLKAKFSFEDGSVVKEITQSISPTDTLVTGFHVTDDAGWPPGRYKLEILVNDQSDGRNHAVAVTEYEVVK